MNATADLDERQMAARALRWARAEAAAGRLTHESTALVDDTATDTHWKRGRDSVLVTHGPRANVEVLIITGKREQVTLMGVGADRVLAVLVALGLVPAWLAEATS